MIEGERPTGGAGVERRDGVGTARRPYLDGLRAVAVAMVLLYHSALSQVRGGFIGVDVFFVLSGYLVTQILTRDINGVGSIRFARFYARRFRRLLPALAAMLLITGLVYSMVASPAELTQVVAGFKAAFLYVMNWYLIHQAAHHGGVILIFNPTLLVWSLAVEEQFYLVWPALLAALFVVTRRASHQLAIIRTAIAVGALASLTWALVADPSLHPYYRTDARAYELFAGALLALTPGLVSRLSRRVTVASILAVIALVGLLFIAGPTLHISNTVRAVPATALTGLIILAMEADPRGAVARVLSTAPIVYLGLVSYGIYLWQWPIILILARYAHPNAWQIAAITALLATGLASLSYQLLERPIRENRLLDRAPRATIVVGLATTVVCALVLVPVVLHPRTHSAPRAPGAEGPGSAVVPVPRRV